MPTGVSAVPQTSGTTKKEMDYAAWDPQFSVPVIEILGYEEIGGSGFLNRVVVSSTGHLLVSGSTGGGTISLSADAAGNRVSAFQTDAGLLHVSAIGGTNSPLSADSSSVSAKQESAANLRISAFSNDGGLLRVSAVGGAAGDNVIVDGTDQTLSATIQRVSGSVSAGANALTVYAQNRDDAANLRVSARGTVSTFINEGSVSAKQGAYPWSVSGNVSASLNEGTNFLGNVSATVKNYPLVVSGTVSAFLNEGTVSAKQGTTPWNVATASGNAVSASQYGGWSLSAAITNASIPVTQSGTWSLSSLLTEGTAFAGNVSATVKNYPLIVSGQISANVDSGSVSAKQGSYPWSVSGNISAALNEGANFLGNVSATIKNYPVTVSGTISAFINQGTVSAAGGSLSALLKEGTAFVGQVSAAGGQLSATLKEGTAFVGQTSAQLVANTVGTLSVYRSLNVSASQAVKATAGSLYGYYLANSDTKFNYIKFYNTSGAINVGTDTPILTIPIPPSAAANVEFPHGLIGFTNGIGIAALSAIADDATTASPASAVVANILYK